MVDGHYRLNFLTYKKFTILYFRYKWYCVRSTSHIEVNTLTLSNYPNQGCLGPDVELTETGIVFILSLNLTLSKADFPYECLNPKPGVCVCVCACVCVCECTRAFVHVCRQFWNHLERHKTYTNNGAIFLQVDVCMSMNMLQCVISDPTVQMYIPI